MRKGITNKLACWFIGSIVCWQTGEVRAQELLLTLDRTIEIATDSSLQAFSAKNMYQAGYWQYRTYQAGRLPLLSLNLVPASYYRDITRRYDSETNLDVYRQQQSLYASGNLSIQQNLDLTGGTFFLDSELAYMRNFGDKTYSQFTTVPIRLGYSQKLFGFNPFKWEKRIEPLKFDKTKKKLVYNMQEIAEYSTQYFFELAMAQMQYDVTKENLASSDTLYRIGQERYKIVSISQSDLLTLKLDAVNARNSLKNAELALKRAMVNFASFLNMNQDTPIRLVLPERPKNIDVTVADALAHAQTNNPDFMTNKQEVLEAEREVEKTKKSSNFDASFSASVGFNQVAEDFGNAYQNPLQQDIVSIGLKIPLIDWGVRKGKANMAKSNLNVTRLSAQQKEVSLQQDVVMTVNDFNVQQDLIQSADEALKLGIEAYSITKQRFLLGQADISSLTLALNRQMEAQRNYILSLQNYWQSYYKIRKLTLFDFESGQALLDRFDEEYGFK